MEHCCTMSSCTRRKGYLTHLQTLAISRDFHKSNRTITRIFKEYKVQETTGNRVNMNPKKSSGRPSGFTDEKAASIVSITNEHGQLISYTEIADVMNEEGIEVSGTTVWRYSKILGVVQKYLHIRPLLIECVRMQRLRYVCIY